MDIRIAGIEFPKTKKGRNKIFAILETSFNIWSEAGHAGFSLHEVARRLNIRLSNVQYYFPTKDKLLLAMFSYRFYLLKESWQEKFESSSDPQQVLDTVLEFELELGVDESIVRLYWQTFLVASLVPEVKEELNQVYRWLLYKYTMLIVDLRPDLREPQITDLAVNLFSLLQGAHNMLCLQPEKEQWQLRYRKLALNLVRDFTNSDDSLSDYATTGAELVRRI